MRFCHVLVFGILLIIANRGLAVAVYSPQLYDPVMEPICWTEVPELNDLEFNCMAEDENGDIWFGCRGLLVRYDMDNWTYYPLPENAAEARILSICPDLRGSIYIGTESGLYIYHSGELKRILPVNGDGIFRVNQVCQFSDGSIWAATEAGLVLFQDDIITLYTDQTMGGRFKDNLAGVHIRLFQYDFSAGLVLDTICQDKSNDIFFWLESGNIIKVDHADPSRVLKTWTVINDNKAIEVNVPRNLFLARDGKIWAIASQSNIGIHIYDPDKEKWSELYLSKLFGVDDTNESIIQTRDGKIWIGGLCRLFTYQNGQWTQYTQHKTQIPAARIVLLETRDGKLWLGGKHNEIYWIDYSHERWEIFNGLNFHCQSSDGKRWFISVDKRIVVFDPKDETWISYGVEDDVIENPLVLFQGPNGLIWSAGSHQSIAASAYFDGSKWVRHLYPDLGQYIQCQNVFVATDSTIWLTAFYPFTDGSSVGGVINVKRNKSGKMTTTRFTFEELGSKTIRGITQDRDGAIWTAGLMISKYTNHHWQGVTEPIEFTTGWLDDIKCDNQGGLWAAKEGVGVFYKPYHANDWKKYSMADGLANNTVLYILPLHDNTILAGTSNGISRFDGRSWIKYTLPPSIQMEREGGMMLQTDDNSIWIDLSALSWNRNAYKFVSQQEKEYIENHFRTIRFIPENKPPKTEILLSPDRVSDEGNIFIQWQGSDYLYSTPGNMLQYSYRLDNSEWSEFTNETQKLFLSLKHGAHVFEIRARDWDMNVEPTPQRHIFIVSSPMWMQPAFIWFISLISIVIVVLVLFLYNKQSHIKKMKAARKHEMEIMRQRFYTNITHDLRTPLNLILEPLSDLLDKTKNDDKRLLQQYELMQRNAQRLNKMVDEIIDFSKIDEGVLEYSPSSGDIVGFIQDISGSFKMLAVKRGIKFNFNSSCKSCYVLFDKQKLETIVYNLLSNALKYTPVDGKINLKLKFQPKEYGELMELRIENSGQTIPDAKIETVFERFAQLDNTKYGTENSSGIGLAITKEMVEICKGTITLQNWNSDGVVFVIQLPLESFSENSKKNGQFTHEEIKAELHSFEKLPENDEEKPVVLVVEDYDDEREYLVSQLMDSFDVISASNGKQGMQKAFEVIPDLIVSDIKMPEMNGIEFCKTLHDNRVTSHIPFIFLTGNRSEEIELEGIRVGADDFITKPFKISVLLARIYNIFDSRRKLKEGFSDNFQFDLDEITSKDKEFFNKALEIVNKHMDDETFDIQQFCAEIGMSRSQLFRKFKSLTGESPNTYIRRVRLQKAAYLLKKTQMNVTEICFEVGYKYLGHFSTDFKKQYGMSPKEFQKDTVGI